MKSEPGLPLSTVAIWGVIQEMEDLACRRAVSLILPVLPSASVILTSKKMHKYFLKIL